MKKYFFDAREMKAMQTLLIQMQGSEVKLDIEAFNGAVKILGIEVAGLKEKGSEIGADLKKAIADELVNRFPEIFRVGGTHHA